MLDSLRQSVRGWPAKILFVLLAVSFAAWGIADVYTGRAAQTVATVGGRDVTINEFQRSYENQLRAFSNRLGRQLTREEVQALNFPEQVLRQLIGGASLDAHAERLRLGVTDDVIARQILEVQAFQGSDGRFDRAKYEQILRANDLTEAAFVVDERRQTIRRQLLETVTAPSAVPVVLIEAVNRYQNETRVVKYFALPPQSIGEVAPATPEQTQNYYDANKAAFTLPEYRRFTVLAVTPDALKPKMQVSEDELKAAYEARKDTFGTPERRKLQQISFSDMATAQAARAKLTQPGADFTAIAKEYGFSATDIDLGMNAKSELNDKKVAEAAFALEKGAVSQPIDGALSLAIVRVVDVVPGFVKSFDEVKDDLRQTLAGEKAADEVAKLLNTVEDRRAGGGKVSEIGQEIGVPVVEFTTAQNGDKPGGGKTEGLPAAENLLREVFLTAVDAEGPSLEVTGGGTVWFDVAEVIAPRLKPFEEVKDEAARLWREAEIKSRLAAKAQELVKAAKPGGDLAAIAQTAGAEVKTSQPLKRTGAEPGLPISAVAVAFGLQQGEIEAVPSAAGQTIVQVSAINPPAPFDAKQMEDAKKELEQALSNDYAAQYLNAIQADLGVAINTAALSAITGQQ